MTSTSKRWNSTARVLLAVLVLLNLVGMAYNIRATAFIRVSSTSVVTDLLLRLLYFGFMVGITVSEVLFVDQVAFRGGWRKRVLGGLRGRAAHLEDEDEPPGEEVSGQPQVESGEEDGQLGVMAGGMRDYTAHVSLLFLVLLGLNYAMFNLVNGGFDSYYRKVGLLYTQLRSPDVDTRVKALAQLAVKRHKGVSLRLLERLEKGTAEEKSWASWALGYRAAYGLLPSDLRPRAERLVLPLVSSGSMAHRSSAAVALARLESYQWLDPAVGALSEPDSDSRFAIALGLLGDRRPAAVQALGKVLARKKNGRLARSVVWALGQIRAPESRSLIESALFALDEEGRCIAVEALGQLGSKESVATLVRLFESKLSAVRCPQVVERLRPDGEGDLLYLYYWDSRAYRKLGCVRRREPLRVRILEVLWRIGDQEILPWIRSRAESGDVSQAVRDCAVRVYNASVD